MKKVHALDLFLNMLCGGGPGRNRTSIVRNRRDRLAKLVTCKTCLRVLSAQHPKEQ